MAHVALLGGYEVTRRDADGAGTIVAAVTVTDHICVIDPDHRNPRGVAMTILADIRGVDMAVVFPHGCDAVVTTDAVGGVICVIEVCR
jgi:hypothetical protein